MVNVAILGFGTVGSGVAEVIHKNGSHISEKVANQVAVKYILDIRDFPDSVFADKIIHDFSIIEKDVYKRQGHARTYIQDVIIPQAEDAQATLNTQAYNPSLSSTIYSGDGTELKTLYARENRVWVTYDEIPKYLIEATVAIEDKRFWEHHGVDWKRTAGAVVYMFTGRDVQGGSTLTQQLIKNISDNDDVTVKRKVLEIFSALEFEKTHSKEEILEMYLNYIYLGRQCNGVYTAAHKYFDKEVNELDLAECASLISITNNPSIYDPINHRDNNMKRASTVVIQMYKQDKISEEEELARCV